MAQKTHLALFAGLGGFIVACNRKGYKTIFANDFEKSCCETLENTFPDVPVDSTDIRDLKIPKEIKNGSPIDILSGGFPCQSFSNAGEMAGFDDPRGKLFFEIPRICKEFKSPPKVLLLENVPHLKTFDNGSRLSTVINKLKLAGYWVHNAHAVILNSKELCGLPQNRDRLFIVAYHKKYFSKNHFDMAKIMNRKNKNSIDLWSLVNKRKKQESHYYLEESNKYYKMVAKEVKKHGNKRLYQVRRTMVRVCKESNCPTLTANMGGGGHNVPFVKDKYGIRKLTVEECLALQGYKNEEILFPEKISNSNRYTMIGNAIIPGMAEKVIDSINTSL